MIISLGEIEELKSWVKHYVKCTSRKAVPTHMLLTMCVLPSQLQYYQLLKRLSQLIGIKGHHILV